MKNSEKNKPTKKKILTYYLILAACLLVVAAVTVGVIFAVRPNAVTPPDIVDGGNTNNPTPPDDDNKPDEPVDTSSQYEFIVPVKDVNLVQAHVFAYDTTLNRYCLHEGMDFACAAGSDVFAAVDGTVKSIELNDTLYGASVTIEHADGVTTVYRFIEPDEDLKTGAKIDRGTVIGKVASATGIENAVGDHLHFEVYKNSNIQDPDDYLNITSK